MKPPPPGWGTVADAGKHERYAQEAHKRPGRRRRCPWGGPGVGGYCMGFCTHLGMANGLALTSGCQWHVAMWVRDPSWKARRRFARPA